MSVIWNFLIATLFFVGSVQFSNTVVGLSISENAIDSVDNECPDDSDGMVQASSTPDYSSEATTPAENEDVPELSETIDDAETEDKPIESDPETPPEVSAATESSKSNKQEKPESTEKVSDNVEGTTAASGPSTSEGPDLRRTYYSVSAIINKAGKAYDFLNDTALKHEVRNSIQQYLINPVIRGTAPCKFFSKIEKCFHSVDDDVKVVTMESENYFDECCLSNRRENCAYKSSQRANGNYTVVTEKIINCTEDGCLKEQRAQEKKNRFF
ncbi:uncharacterized protein LOC129760134 [Uranotaenia lowii]|uniref:uncharacterized protein LOC129760134 n=1 Tax=Uranotaenia lowii TaxID=190385 RepID=UPI00247AABBC|nr:uncharacterized protein LOC129760134 [Uranotaenia lowii]